VKKTEGEPVVMTFKPENISSEEPDAISSKEASAGCEIKVVPDDLKNACANAMYSLQEKFGERAEDAREIVIHMADTLDKFKGHGSLAAQQDDQQAGVLLRPMYPAAEAPCSKDGKEIIILCIYRATPRSEPNLQRTMNQFVGNSKLKVLGFPADAVKQFVSVLDANADKLDSNLRSSQAWRDWFLQWAKSPHQSTSAALPDLSYGFTQSYISTRDFASARDSGPKGTHSSCDHCSQGNAKNRCTRCGQVFYCSKDCQQAAWPRHQTVCKSGSEKLESGDIVTADVTVAPEGMQGFSLAGFNLHKPVAKMTMGAVKKIGASTSRKEGDVCVIKIQIGGTLGTPMMVYDHKRMIEFMLHPANASEGGCGKIFHLIREKGEAGGRKGYFNCQVTNCSLNPLMTCQHLHPSFAPHYHSHLSPAA
jgi:hypothetical protein